MPRATIRVCAATLLPLLWACGTSPQSVGLRVEVELSAGLSAQCAKVEVRDLSGAALVETMPMPLSGKDRLVVGLARGELPSTIRVQARGYQDPECAAGTFSGEASDEREGTFASPPTVISLVLARPVVDGGVFDGGVGDGGLVDADGDGTPLPADCDDADPAVRPGATEVCTDGKDNDCSGGADCADPVCDTLTCKPGSTTRCAGGQCTETQCANALDDDGDGAADCADSNCAGQACGTNGLCTAQVCVAPTEVGLCFDGADNDGDGRADCLDADCPQGAMCSDVNVCTENDTCGGDGGCQSGGLKACTTPPNAQCYLSAGSCQPDAGGACAYVPTTSGCNDGRACTTGDTCDGDGGCAGAQVPCSTPPGACFAPAGACSEALAGACVYPPRGLGFTCSDLDDCTDGDGCDGDGGCAAGTRRPCLPPGECWMHDGACFGDGGCGFAARTGLACSDGGTCNAGGACVVTPIFGYTPSNFTEPQLPTSAGALHFGCGTTGLDTASADGGVEWVNNCPGNQQNPDYELINVGNLTAVLLYADALGIDAGSTLRAVGARPLILAVRNDATIRGTLDVGSTKTSRGAAGGAQCSPMAGGAGTAGTASGSPETAGGGGGGAFGGNGSDGTDGANGGPHGVRGLAIGTATLIPLRGGCSGGNGGRVGSPWGQGGNGGGAVQLSVGGALVIGAGATVTAYGAGGRGGEADMRTAGGGAGAGGGILLEGNTVTVASTGAVTANGGAGGEGSGYGGAQWYGRDGQDGLPRAITAALCVSAGACGGDGAPGGSRSGGAGTAGAPSCGTNMPGGGGGGGVGIIRLNAQTSCNLVGGNIISPQATGNRAGCF
jgi:Putative metal-binding motif